MQASPRRHRRRRHWGRPPCRHLHRRPQRGPLIPRAPSVPSERSPPRTSCRTPRLRSPTSLPAGLGAASALLWRLVPPPRR
eukprot:702361-Pyramimonas_sp.AAC.1